MVSSAFSRSCWTLAVLLFVVHMNVKWEHALSEALPNGHHEVMAMLLDYLEDEMKAQLKLKSLESWPAAKFSTLRKAFCICIGRNSNIAKR